MSWYTPTDVGNAATAKKIPLTFGRSQGFFYESLYPLAHSVAFGLCLGLHGLQHGRGNADLEVCGCWVRLLRHGSSFYPVAVFVEDYFNKLGIFEVRAAPKFKTFFGGHAVEIGLPFFEAGNGTGGGIHHHSGLTSHGVLLGDFGLFPFVEFTFSNVMTFVNTFFIFSKIFSRCFCGAVPRSLSVR